MNVLMACPSSSLPCPTLLRLPPSGLVINYCSQTCLSFITVYSFTASVITVSQDPSLCRGDSCVLNLKLFVLPRTTIRGKYNNL